MCAENCFEDLCIGIKSSTEVNTHCLFGEMRTYDLQTPLLQLIDLNHDLLTCISLQVVFLPTVILIRLTLFFTSSTSNAYDNIILHNRPPLFKRLDILLGARHQIQNITLGLGQRHDLAPLPPRISRPLCPEHGLPGPVRPPARGRQVDRAGRNVLVEERALKEPQARLGLVARHHVACLEDAREAQVAVLAGEAEGDKGRFLGPGDGHGRVAGGGEFVLEFVWDGQGNCLSADPLVSGIFR